MPLYGRIALFLVKGYTNHEILHPSRKVEAHGGRIAVILHLSSYDTPALQPLAVANHIVEVKPFAVEFDTPLELEFIYQRLFAANGRRIARIAVGSYKALKVCHSHSEIPATPLGLYFVKVHLLYAHEGEIARTYWRHGALGVGGEFQHRELGELPRKGFNHIARIGQYKGRFRFKAYGILLSGIRVGLNYRVAFVIRSYTALSIRR